MSGKWIVFEGLDGAGTTTQVELFCQRLLSTGVDSSKVFRTAEPTDGPFGQLCRKALRGEISLDPCTLALSFSTDRSHHLHKEEGILDHRRQEHWVVMDRYLYSTLAYQSEASSDWLQSLYQPFPRPDLVVFIDTPVSECLRRIERRGQPLDVFEEESLMKAIRESYRRVQQVEETHTPWFNVSGLETPDSIADLVWERVCASPDR